MDRPVGRSRGLTRTHLVALGIALALLIVGALALPSLRTWSSVDRSVGASQIRTARVSRGDLLRDASAQGKVVAALHPTLFAPVAGIVALKVKAGDAVARGAVLAEIESPELKSQLLQEKTTLASLQSALERQRLSVRQAAQRSQQAAALLEVKLEAAKRGLERDQRSFEQGILNRIDYEKSKDDVRVATMELTNARESGRLDVETGEFDVRDRGLSVQRQRAVVDEMERQVGRLVIQAPFDGMVASVAVQDRDAIPANGPVLTVVNLSQYEIEFQLPENYASDLAAGSDALILYEGRELPGKVTAISPEVKDSLVKGTVVFASEPPAGLRQSQRVSVRMVFEKKTGVLKVTRGPFLEVGGGRQAYVVDGDVARKKPIETGVVSVSEVEILSGAAEGDEIVISDTTDFQGAKSVLVRRNK